MNKYTIEQDRNGFTVCCNGEPLSTHRALADADAARFRYMKADHRRAKA